jgi:outer membrane immunogenic protein
MNKLWLAAAFLALSAASASAADLPARTYSKAPVIVDPAYNWSGFYIGANAGGHWGRDRLTTAANPLGFVGGAAAELNALSAGSLKPNGFVGGGQIGYNWQINNVLVGVEADAVWLDGTATRSITYPTALVLNPADIMTNATHATWLATIRGRLGVTFDRTLLYVTGGAAFGEVKTTDTFCAFGCLPLFLPGAFSSVSASTTRVGWTAGVGLEHAITNNWSLKLEYLYVDLGSFSTSIPPCPLCLGVPIASDVTVNHRYSDNIVRVGINYRFGGPVVARY